MEVASDLDSYANGKQGNLNQAIKGARAGKSFKNIDDEFDIDPDVGASKKGKMGFGRDNLRQGVSSGFNFKEILNSQQ